MNKAIFCGLATLIASSAVQAKPTWLTMDGSTLKQVPNLHLLQQAPSRELPAYWQRQGLALVEVDEAELSTINDYIHQQKQRCGGYFAFNSKAEALRYLAQTRADTLVASGFTAPPISQQALLTEWLVQLNPAAIAQTITDLSQFTNRYYTTSAGQQAADWIATRWGSLTQGLSFATVSRVSHQGYNQRSVLLELRGSERPEEIVVLGAHLDSIVSGGTSETTRAPGADDDASGVATLTEIIRLLAAQKWQPKRTIRFYGYAAEEVGLRGSKDIATASKNRAELVQAVMQLDMTSYQGGAEDIVLMTDYTHADLNAYLSTLAKVYQPNLLVSTDVCGYGCSDHASWHNAGYPASLPFEAKFARMNPNIHTIRDTLANADSSGKHALKFAKLGLSYAVELGLATGTTPPPPTQSGQFSNLAATKGSWLYRTIELPAGLSQLQVQMSGGTGDADLYVQAGQNPTTTSYLCRPYKTGNSESCTLNAPKAGSWVIGLRAYSSFSGVNVSWQAK